MWEDEIPFHLYYGNILINLYISLRIDDKLSSGEKNTVDLRLRSRKWSALTLLLFVVLSQSLTLRGELRRTSILSLLDSTMLPTWHCLATYILKKASIFISNTDVSPVWVLMINMYQHSIVYRIMPSSLSLS